MIVCMTSVIVQTQLPANEVQQLDRDRKLLGLVTRSDAIRQALRLLHKRAEDEAIIREYDEFYGKDVRAPLSDLSAIGDVGEASQPSVKRMRGFLKWDGPTISIAQMNDDIADAVVEANQ